MPPFGWQREWDLFSIKKHLRSDSFFKSSLPSPQQANYLLSWDWQHKLERDKGSCTHSWPRVNKWSTCLAFWEACYKKQIPFHVNWQKTIFTLNTECAGQKGMRGSTQIQVHFSKCSLWGENLTEGKYSNLDERQPWPAKTFMLIKSDFKWLKLIKRAYQLLMSEGSWPFLVKYTSIIHAYDVTYTSYLLIHLTMFLKF